MPRISTNESDQGHMTYFYCKKEIRASGDACWHEHVTLEVVLLYEHGEIARDL